MNKFKQKIISEAVSYFDKIYLHVLPHEKLIIGKRGLINSEKNNGIVLAVGSSSCTDLRLNDEDIYARLRFNGVWEDVIIPYEAVDALLNDLHKPTCIFNFPVYEKNEAVNNNTVNTDSSNKKQAVIIKPDFTNKK